MKNLQSYHNMLRCKIVYKINLIHNIHTHKKKKNVFTKFENILKYLYFYLNTYKNHILLD